MGGRPSFHRREAARTARLREFYLAAVIDVPELPPGPEPDGWLGVDLGIVNLATDSDGTTYSGKAVRAVRYRKPDAACPVVASHVA